MKKGYLKAALLAVSLFMIGSAPIYALEVRFNRAQKSFDASLKRFRKCMRREQCTREEWRKVARDVGIAAIAMAAIITGGALTRKVLMPSRAIPVDEKLEAASKEFPVGRFLTAIGDKPEEEYYVKDIIRMNGHIKILYGHLSEKNPNEWTVISLQGAQALRDK